jgi:transposase
MAKKRINKSKNLNGIVVCSSCFEKQLKIDRLEEEIVSLRAKLKYRDKKNKEDFFGSSTPSSKKIFKTKSTLENQKKKGGAKPGHKNNNGRKIFDSRDADEVVDYEIETTHCPCCHTELENKEVEERPIIEGQMLKPKRILFRNQIKRCPKCRKTFRKKLPVLKKHKYGTQFVSNSAVMHYINGIPLKRIEELWGNDVVSGNLIKIFHRIANLFNPIMEQLKQDYRQSEVKHADETSWRTDGANGYAWLFASQDTSLFAFRETRSAKVVRENIGEEKIPGVLVVDRYAGYNKVPCKIQYCYSHLLRDIQDLEKKIPGNKEIKNFVNCSAKLISKAIKLRNKKISNKKYYEQALDLKKKIMETMNSPGKHPGVQKIQNIFREKEHRLFHWVNNQNVPADNNFAERELRPTVIARKVSHGSQSVEGAKTRSILMSILHTAKKRLKNKTVDEWFNEALQTYIHNPDIDPLDLLPDLGE